MRYANAVVTILFLCFLSSPAAAQVPGAGTLTTKAVIEQVESSLKDTIDHAVERGDYLLAKAAIEMRASIDAWETANSHLLDKAFTEVDEASRNLFADARQLVATLDQNVETHLKSVQDITVGLNHIAESTILSDGRSYILYQEPRIVPPTARDTIRVRLKGVNLGRADAQLFLNGEELPRFQLGETVVEFEVPVPALNANPEHMQLHTLKLRHRSRDGSILWLFPTYEDVEREITLATLPLQVAHFNVEGMRVFKQKQVQVHSVSAGKFEGTNTSVHKIARAPAGWQWDIVDNRGAFSVIATGGGEAGSCQEIQWNGSNAHGIEIRARVDRIVEGPSWDYPAGRVENGYIHCGIRGPAFRMVDAQAAIDPITGDVVWTEDTFIPIPDDASDFRLRVKLFNGKIRLFTNSAPGKFLDVTRVDGGLLLRPLVPDDIL